MCLILFGSYDFMNVTFISALTKFLYDYHKKGDSDYLKE